MIKIGKKLDPVKVEIFILLNSKFTLIYVLLKNYLLCACRFYNSEPRNIESNTT